MHLSLIAPKTIRTGLRQHERGDFDMTRGLTEKQEHILSFIMEYINERGYPPSIREIGVHFAISSLRGVTVHLDALQRKGYITRSNTARAITVIGQTGSTSPNRNITSIPIFTAAATPGRSVVNETPEGFLPVSQEMVFKTPDAYAIRVKGDSMIGAHICDGDLVIIRPQVDAENGDTVVCTLGEDAFIKTLHKGKDGSVSLISENPLYPPIEVRREDGRIQGKVIGLIRMLH